MIINSRGLFKVAQVFSLDFEIIRFLFYFSVNYKDFFLLKVLEDKITSLPWLEDAKTKKTEIDDKQAESNPGAKPAFKPYVSGEFLQHLD